MSKKIKKVKVACVRYTDADGGWNLVQRGETHDFSNAPAKWFERMDGLDAFTDPDEELVVLGDLLEPDGSTGITAESSLEEVIAWLASATLSEALTLMAQAGASDDPDFKRLIEDGLEHLADTRQNELESQAELIKRVAEEKGVGVTTEGLTTRHPASEVVDGAVTLETATNPGPAVVDPVAETTDEADLEAPAVEDELDDLDDAEIEDPDLVVTFPLTRIAPYLDAHPDQAHAIMDAEVRRVAVTDEEPRVGLVRLVQTVVGHSEG